MCDVQGLVVVEQIETCTAPRLASKFVLVSTADWQQAVQQGYYAGDALDRKDGFIHMCTLDSIAVVQAAVFPNRSDVLAAEYSGIPASQMSWKLANGLAYPHFMGHKLPVSGGYFVKVHALPPVSS